MNYQESKATYSLIMSVIETDLFYLMCISACQVKPLQFIRAGCQLVLTAENVFGQEHCIRELVANVILTETYPFE